MKSNLSEAGANLRPDAGATLCLYTRRPGPPFQGCTDAGATLCLDTRPGPPLGRGQPLSVRGPAGQLVW